MNSLENILSHQIVQKLGWTLLHFIWQATAAAILLAFLLRIMRRFSASLRYVAACLTLGLIVLLPVVTLQLINVPPQPSIVKIEPEPAPAPIIAPIQTTEEITIAESIEYAEPVRREPARLNYFAALKQKTADTLEPALQYIVTGWLLGVFALSIWHLGGWTQLQRLRRKLVKQVDTSLKTRLNQLSEKLGVNHAVELLESAIVQIPTVVGWIKPVILLPAGALTGLNTEQLEAILAHELAHIKRFDYLINMLQTVVEILGFYHPAVWWVSHKIREERENCCDDLAVTITGDRVRYAKALTLMEEIRGGKSELAVAATGGNLFSRIRRLVGKDSSEKSFSWIPAATVVLLLIALAIPTTVALTSNSNEAPDQTAIEKMLIDGFRENRDKFERGVLAWTLTDKNEGLAGKPKTETKGSFQLWWDGKKIATRFSQERMDLDAGVVIDRRSGGNVYDGGLLSRKPKFETFEDWFGQIIHWTGPRSMDQEIPALKKRENIALDFSKTIVDGRELAKFVSRNTDESDVSFRSYIVKYFDPSKSYGLINEEWYTGENKLYLKHTFTLREVIPGGWFPVEVDLKAFSLKDSTVYVDRQLALDLKRCSFNDPAAIPEGIFKFSTVKEQEQLNKILEKCSKGTMINTDIVENVRIRNACESVENYIAAALAGENEKAAEYAVPGSAVAQQTDDTRQVFQGQAAQILAVSSDDWNAMAISSVIQADRGRTGTVVFYLKKEILEQKVHWLIDDIDIETLDSIEAEIGRFLERNPGAILALFRPQRPVITPTNSAGEQSDTQVREETKISELLDKLEDEKYAHTRSEIIPLIEEIGDKEPASFLAGQLLADSRKRRCNAALVLELLGDRRGVPAIINELKDTSFRTTTRIRSDGTLYQDGQVTEDHYYAALLLGILGDERAVSSLIEATRDEKIDYQAAISLGQIGDKSAVPVLREMLKRCSDNPFSRLFAGYGLAMLNDKEGLKVVIDTLNEHQEDWTIRRHAIEALGKLGDKEATPYLIAALKDEHPNIKVSVAKALGEIGDVTALPALEQALEDKTVTKVNAPTSVSEIAAEAISQIQSWGEAVEDAQIRLLNAAQIWGQADWPHSVVRLRLDARNRGPRYLHLPENGLNWQIQVDGIWYEWVGFFNATTSDRETIVSSRGGRLFDFNPHDSHTDLKVDIGIGWRKIPNGKEIEFGRRRYSGGWPVIDNNEYGPELILQSGTHRLRVAIICPPSRAGYYEPVRLISNPVEIEILPGENTADSQVEREENRILSIDLQTENNQRFKFGQLTPSAFILKNISDKTLVVLGIEFISNNTEYPIRLSGSAYGSINKLDNQDAYRYNQLNQRATQLAFYAGFLLPDQEVTVKTDFRPVASKESLDITYISASNKYDGTKESLKPFNPYIPKYIEHNTPNYYPFAEQDWIELHQTYPQASRVGPDAPKRAVLIPDLRQEARHIKVNIPINYETGSFPLESAMVTASKINGLPPTSFRLAYSTTLGGYAVIENDLMWILKNKNQTSKGELFNGCPTSLLNDIDRQGSVRIRIGNKQEGFGPDEHPAGRNFWDTYPVYYGDGMYTHGEFISIEKNNLLSFLRKITEKNEVLKEHPYFFNSRFFEFVPSNENPESQNSAVQLEEKNSTEDKNSALLNYLKISEALYKGNDREEIARRYYSAGNKYPNTRYGRICLELGRLLEQMAIEDKNFKPPQDIDSLIAQEKINYYIYKLRDVAEQEVFGPGKCRVLREPRTPDSAAVALREMGTAVVPAMISLLEDRRPTRSVGQPRNGGVVLRNCDVALEILADIAGQNLPNNTTTFDPRSERGAFLSSADEKTAAEIIQRVKQWWQTTENNSSVQPDDEKDGRQPQSEYKKTLESGVTVELIGMCEYPSAGKQWWRPNGSVLENPPYDNSSIYTTGTRPFDSIPTELAFRLSSRLKEPAYEALIKMDDKILVHTTNNRLTGTTGQISEDGQVPSDIIAVGLYVPQNRKTTDFSLSLVIDGKRYEWFEFKNIAIRPNMGNDTVLNAEEKIFGSLEQSDARLLRSFLNQVDSEIHKLKDDYPQLADWDKEQTKTALLRTGKEITDTRLTYYHAAFAGNSPSGQDWCENNGCYIRVKLSTGLESPYMKTMSLPLKEGRLLALATVITDKPENRELEQKINEIITTTAASIRQKTEAQAESAKPKEPNKGQSAVQIEMRLLHTSENFPEEVGRKLNLKLDFNTPLDDLQIDSLIKAAQADEGTKMLAAPKVTVLDNQDAQFFIGHEVPSISGYTIAEEPKPVIEYKRIGIICELTPHVSPDGQNVFTELELEFSQLTGFKERVFQGILQEQVPQFETNNVATSKTIPGGKTLLIDGGPITIYEKKKSTSAETTTDSSERTKEKKRLIILIKPVILSPEQVEALGLNETPPPAMMGEYSYGYGQGDPPLGLGGMGGNSYGTPPPEISKRESTNLENRGTVENISPTGKSSILANEISDTSVISEDDNDIIRRIKEAIEPELSHQAGGITGSNLGGLVDTNNTNQSNIDIGTSEKARFFTRADNEKITGEFGFDTLQRKEGGLWELSKPYKNIYQPDFTCYITADKASITLETAAETTITKDVTFSGNVLIHFIPASSGDLKETKIYCDKLAFYSDSSQTMIDGPTTVVLGDSLTGDIIPGTPPLEIQKLQKAGKPMTIVYDISDLAGTTDDVNNLIRRIKETIEPDSWWEKGGIGTITAFPAPQPRKLSVYQSAQIHQEIQKFLDTMRPTSGEEFIPSAQPTFPQNWDQIMKWIESAKNGPNEKTSGREKIRQQIDELSERFKELETRRKNLQAQAEMFEKYRELPGNRQEYINNLPSVKSLAEKLAEVEKELIEARQMYTESHPQVRQLIQLQQELNKRLDEKRQEAGRAYDQSINPEARQQELDDLRAELEATKPLVQQLRDTLEKENKEAKAPENKPEKPQLSNKILIEAKILKVTDDFLEYAGLDANSLAESDIWSKYLVPDSNGSPHFIIDKLNTDLLIKAAESHKYCNIIKWPILTAKNGKPAEMAMVDQEYFFLGTSNEPNDSDGKKISELQEIATGTTIRLTPELTEENKTVRLDCEVKINWLKEFKKQKIGNTEMPIPQISTFEDTSLTLIPDGYTLLIRGEKITKTTEKQESRPILNLPIVNRIFRTKSEIKITDEYTPLILIQPSIVTQQ